MCYVRLFVLWERCHVVWRNKSSSSWAGSWAEDVCLALAGGHLTATHHLGADTYWNTHTRTVLGCLTPPPTHSLVLTLSRINRTSMIIQPTKTERLSFNHAAHKLEKVVFLCCCVTCESSVHATYKNCVLMVFSMCVCLQCATRWPNTGQLIPSCAWIWHTSPAC